MKKIFFSITLFLVLGNVYGQKLDSIANDYGQLFYHSYGSGETIIMLSGGPGNNAMQLIKSIRTEANGHELFRFL